MTTVKRRDFLILLIGAVTPLVSRQSRSTRAGVGTHRTGGDPVYLARGRHGVWGVTKDSDVARAIFARGVDGVVGIDLLAE